MSTTPDYRTRVPRGVVMTLQSDIALALAQDLHGEALTLTRGTRRTARPHAGDTRKQPVSGAAPTGVVDVPLATLDDVSPFVLAN
jgi:hypothetical protein